MKSIAFAALLVAIVNAGYPAVYKAPTVTKAASSANVVKAKSSSDKYDSDAWGRDQDLHISESYDKTGAKAYDAESYDEWDNVDEDDYSAEAWNKSQNAANASSYGKAASTSKPGYGKGYGKSYGSSAASADYDAQEANADKGSWAKQANGTKAVSRYGKSYDSVNARSYDNESYAKDVEANDNQWASKSYTKRADAKSYYGDKAARSYDRDGDYYGDYSTAKSSSAYGKASSRARDSDKDAWGRDQKLKMSTSYAKTAAKKYGAESYDEWDNKDRDYYGKQAWNRDAQKDGASSYSKAASKSGDRYGKGYGYGADKASTVYGAATAKQGDDAWAKSAKGDAKTSRYGKSYDSVTAKNYDNESYARKVDAKDSQWADYYDDASEDAEYDNDRDAARRSYRRPAYKAPAYKTPTYRAPTYKAPTYPRDD